MRCIAAEPEMSSNDTVDGPDLRSRPLQQQQRYDAVLDALGLQVRLARTLGDVESAGRGSSDRLAGMRLAASGGGRGVRRARAAFVTLGNRGEVAACDADLANLAYMQGRFAEAAEGLRRPTRCSNS